MAQGYKRSLRNYLLNSSYQLRFTGVIVVISAILTGGLGYFVMSKAHEASRVVSVQAMDPENLLAQQLATQFAHNDRILMFVLIGFGFMLSLVLAAYGIVLTHKVAGPLFKIALHLDKIRDGKLGKVYPLRQGDELVEFFGHFKAAHDALRKQEEDDVALFERAAASVNDPALKAEIAAVVAQKIESLK